MKKKTWNQVKTCNQTPYLRWVQDHQITFWPRARRMLNKTWFSLNINTINITDKWPMDHKWIISINPPRFLRIKQKIKASNRPNQLPIWTKPKEWNCNLMACLRIVQYKYQNATLTIFAANASKSCLNVW